MQTMVIETVVRDNVIIIPRKLNFKVDASLEDVVPFADILDSRQFVDKLRKDQWQ